MTKPGEYLAVDRGVFAALREQLGWEDAGLVLALEAEGGAVKRVTGNIPALAELLGGAENTLRRALRRLEAAGAIVWQRGNGGGDASGWIEVCVALDARPRKATPDRPAALTPDPAQNGQGRLPKMGRGTQNGHTQNGSNPAQNGSNPAQNGHPAQGKRAVETREIGDTRARPDCDSCHLPVDEPGRYRHPACPPPIHSVPPRPRDWTQKRYDDPLELRPDTEEQRKAVDLALAAEYAAR